MTNTDSGQNLDGGLGERAILLKKAGRIEPDSHGIVLTDLVLDGDAHRRHAFDRTVGPVYYRGCAARQVKGWRAYSPQAAEVIRHVERLRIFSSLQDGGCVSGFEHADRLPPLAKQLIQN